jgi:hypothetical protein
LLGGWRCDALVPSLADPRVVAIMVSKTGPLGESKPHVHNRPSLPLTTYSREGPLHHAAQVFPSSTISTSSGLFAHSGRAGHNIYAVWCQRQNCMITAQTSKTPCYPPGQGVFFCFRSDALSRAMRSFEPLKKDIVSGARQSGHSSLACVRCVAYSSLSSPSIVSIAVISLVLSCRSV